MSHNFAEPEPGSNRAFGPTPGPAAAAIIRSAYDRWQIGFRELTRRAFAQFECRDWRGAAADATLRIQLYKRFLDEALAAIPTALGSSSAERSTWIAARDAYSALAHDLPERELAETFFNSVTRRVLGTVGVNAGIEYMLSPSGRDAAPPIYASYAGASADPAMIRAVLEAIPWTVPYAELERDAVVVAELIDAHLRTTLGAAGPVTLEVLTSMFFRNKGAYLVGRIRAGDRVVPLVLPLLHAERGIVVDAVLLTENEVSIVFGFSWSYFKVEAPRPRALVDFLRSIMPLKRVDELYNSVGYNKHGKTEFYRTLMRHLRQPDARFAFAEGEEGLVMAVFTLPTLNVVFKVIKDRFAPPKRTTRQTVMDKYHFVFVRDRVGRLADAQEFAQLAFPKRCFPDDLLDYLLRVAGETVRVVGDSVVLEHLYTERRVVPLDLFLRDAEPHAARAAVVEFGNAIKDLAAADIFAGDMLLKNFGISRHGRVICYDYDELCLLSECRFRHIPPAQTVEDELAAEPWFPVGEHDVFPEEFATFLVPSGECREAFLEVHGDLLRVEYWQRVQQALAAGELFDVFPYNRTARLRRGERSDS